MESKGPKLEANSSKGLPIGKYGLYKKKTSPISLWTDVRKENHEKDIFRPPDNSLVNHCGPP